MERDDGCGEPGGCDHRPGVTTTPWSRRRQDHDDDELDPEPEVEPLLLEPDEPDDEPDDEPEEEFEPDPESEDPELLDPLEPPEPPELPESEDDEPESDPAAARLSVR